MSGSITIPNFPSNWRVPGVYISNTDAGSVAGVQNNGLIIGQMLSSGSATAGVPVLAVSQSNVNTLCGANSMIANQFAYAFLNSPGTTWYLLPLADASGATASTSAFSFTGTPTASGSVYLYINGNYVPCAITSAETDSQIASSVASTINSMLLGVTAVAATGTVTITAANKGATAGNLPVQINPYGASQGQTLPAGLSVSSVTYTAGTGDPDLASALANLGALSIQYYNNPYATSTLLGETSTLMATDWMPINDIYGQVFSAFQGSASAITTFGPEFNDQYLSIMSVPAASLQAPYIWSAAYCGASANSLASNPSSPLTGVQLLGILPPPNPANNFSQNTRNTFYNNGISSYKAIGGNVYIDLAISTYEVNGLGIPDNNYLIANVPAQLTAVSVYFSSSLGSKFQGYTIVPDPAQTTTINKQTTPLGIKGTLIAIYNDLCNVGLCANPDAYAANVQVQISSTNKGQVLVYSPLQLSSGLYQFAISQVFSIA